MILHKVTFMFRLQVCTPVNRKFKFMSRLLKYFYTFSITQTNKIIFYNKKQSVYQFLVIHACEKINIIPAIIKRITNQVFQKILCQVHIIVDIVEGNFRFNHPELCKVAWSV